MLHQDLQSLQTKKRKAPNFKRDLRILHETFPFIPRDKLEIIYKKCAYSLMDTLYLIQTFYFKDKFELEHVEWIYEKNQYIISWCKTRVLILLDKLESLWSSWFVSLDATTTMKTNPNVPVANNVNMNNSLDGNSLDDGLLSNKISLYNSNLDSNTLNSTNVNTLNQESNNVNNVNNYNTCTDNISYFLWKQNDSHLEEYLEIEKEVNETIIQKKIREQNEHFMEKWIVNVDQKEIKNSINACWRNHHPPATDEVVYRSRLWIEQSRSIFNRLKDLTHEDYDSLDELRIEVCFCKWMIFLGRHDEYVFERLKIIYKWGMELGYEPAIASALVFRGWFYCMKTSLFTKNNRSGKLPESLFQNDEKSLLVTEIKDKNTPHLFYQSLKTTLNKLDKKHLENYDDWNTEDLYSQWIENPYLIQSNDNLKKNLLLEGIESLLRGVTLTTDKHELYLSYRILGDTHALHPNYKEIFNPSLSIGEYNKAYNVACELQYLKEQLILVERIAIFYDRVCNSMDDAHKYYIHGIEIAKKLQDPLVEGILLKNLGTMYLELRQFKFAQDYLSQAENLIPDSNYEKAQCFVNRGRLFQYIGRMEDAAIYYEKARKIYVSYRKILEQIQMYHRIADTLLHRDLASESIPIYMRSIDLSMKSGDYEYQIETFSKISIAYTRINDRTNAIRCLERAQSISNEVINNMEGVIHPKFLKKFQERCLQLMHLHYLQQSYLHALCNTEMLRKISKANYIRRSKPKYQIDPIWLSKILFPSSSNIMIHYTIFREYVYIFILQSTNSHSFPPKVIHATRINSFEIFGKDIFIENLCIALNNYSNYANSDSSSIRILSQLYQCLIQPISSFLSTNKSKCETIVLSPDPKMYFIPFHALYNMRQDSFLYEKYSIEIVPSIDTLIRNQNDYSIIKNDNQKKSNLSIEIEYDSVEFIGVQCPKYRRSQFRVNPIEKEFAISIGLNEKNYIIIDENSCNIDYFNSIITSYSPKIIHFSGRFSIEENSEELYDSSGKFHFKEEGIIDQILNINNLQDNWRGLELFVIPFCDVLSLFRSANILLEKNIPKIMGSLWRCPKNEYILEILLYFYKNIKQCDTYQESLRNSISMFVKAHPNLRYQWQFWSYLYVFGL